MNTQLENLMYLSGMTAQGCWDSFDEYDKQAVEKFAELIYKDIITVVAAHALSNDSAIDVFKNLKRIYEGVED